MDIPAELKYTKEHEWVRIEDDVAIIGITAHAQDALGDIVYVELPEVGAEVASGAEFGVVESVKAVSDIYSPLSGEIVEVNDALDDTPEQVNEDPYGEGWIVKIRFSDPAEVDALFDAEGYRAFLADA